MAATSKQRKTLSFDISFENLPDFGHQIHFLTFRMVISRLVFLSKSKVRNHQTPYVKIDQGAKSKRIIDRFKVIIRILRINSAGIKECINDTLKPLGVAVVIEAQHLCMMMRGVQKQNSVTTTSDFTGAFTKVETREEFIHLIGTKLH